MCSCVDHVTNTGYSICVLLSPVVRSRHFLLYYVSFPYQSYHDQTVNSLSNEAMPFNLIHHGGHKNVDKFNKELGELFPSSSMKTRESIFLFAFCHWSEDTKCPFMAGSLC